MKRINENPKPCQTCGKSMSRKRFNGTLEDFGIVCDHKQLKRQCYYCELEDALSDAEKSLHDWASVTGEYKKELEKKDRLCRDLLIELLIWNQDMSGGDFDSWPDKDLIKRAEEILK